MPDDRPGWIEDVELENAEIKWNWSHFDGRQDAMNSEGDHNFQVILPDDLAAKLREEGWNVKSYPGYEEGDPDQHLLQIKISDRFGLPKVFMIKGTRMIQLEARKPDEIFIRGLSDIRRDTCEQLDVIFTPSRWIRGSESGITAYVKELYVKVKESRFAEKYADYEVV